MKKKIIASILSASILISTLTGCASLSRAVKDVSSDVSGGLNRTVEVYDYSGNLLKTYTGKIDIEMTDGDRIKFDVNGKRYLIYNAIVIVEENSKDEPIRSIADD